MKPKLRTTDAAILALLADPSCPDWVEPIVTFALKVQDCKDPVDAAGVLAHLARLFEARAQEVIVWERQTMLDELEAWERQTPLLDAWER